MSRESPKEIETDNKIKVVLSNITLVSNHQSEHPPHNANVIKNKIMRNNVPHVNKPNFIISSIFYFKF